MAKYNVGDKVVIRHDLVEGNYYQMEDGSCEDTVVSEMMEFVGKIVTITKVKHEYSIGYGILEDQDEDGSGWTWTDEMFEGLA